MPRDRRVASEDELEAGELMLEKGLYEQAVQHAYLAAFHLAREAITSAGGLEPRTHSGTNSAFGKLLIERGMPRDAGRALNLLEQMRQDGTYELVDRDRVEAADALALARIVIAAAEILLDDPKGP